MGTSFVLHIDYGVDYTMANYSREGFDANIIVAQKLAIRNPSVEQPNCKSKILRAAEH